MADAEGMTEPSGERPYLDNAEGEPKPETDPVEVVVVRKGRVLRREYHAPRFDTTLAVNAAMLDPGNQ